MGRHYHYREGSFYRVDDRTGFPQRAENTRKQWDNLIVDEKVWEPRQPQDFVRGTPDYQAVNDARPITDPIFIGPRYVPMSAAAAVGATDIYVQYLAGLVVGDGIGVMLDDGMQFSAALLSIDPSGAFITISQGLPYTAASGNLVCDYGIPA